MSNPAIQFPMPAWLDQAFRFRGLREIPGPKHHRTIMEWIHRLGGWFKDDETPWCGTFVAHCLQHAGLPFPKHWYRARAYETYGTAESRDNIPYGSIAVKGRKGGGHVFFPVAQSPDGRIIYGLGGNQNNSVNIAAFKRSEIIAVRWPPMTNTPKLPLRVARSAAELNAASNVTES